MSRNQKPDISTAPDEGHPLAFARKEASRLGSSTTHEGFRPDLVFAFDGLQFVPVDVRPRVLPLPVNLEASDPAQAQALTLTANGSGEGADSFFATQTDPPAPLGRGPQMLRVVRFELGGGAPDSVEFDIGTGEACTVPSRYVRASVLDYSAELLSDVNAPNYGRDVPPASYQVSAATGVRTPSSRRTQIAYVTGDQFAAAEPGADPSWTRARLFWTPILARVTDLLLGLGG